MPSSVDHVSNEDLTIESSAQESEHKSAAEVEAMIPEGPRQQRAMATARNHLQPALSSPYHQQPHAVPPVTSADGLILPRKPVNPCIESSDRQNLHRELKFNNKIGKNVLNQKSELQKALEKHKDAQAKKEMEQQMIQSTPELEKVIADRAKRLQDTSTVQNEDNDGLNQEFLKARAKLRTRHDSK